MARIYLPSSVPEETPAEAAVDDTPVAPPVKAPAKSATKADWVAYVTEHKGVSPEDADAATRDELAALYGD